jgi:hypothetical protein
MFHTNLFSSASEKTKQGDSLMNTLSLRSLIGGSGRRVVSLATAGLLGLALCLAGPAGTANAANFTWDSSGTTAGISEGNGSWSTGASGTYWATGGTSSAWVNSGTNFAYIGTGGALGGNYTISVLTTASAGGIFFNYTGANAYTITGGTIQMPTAALASSGTITNASGMAYIGSVISGSNLNINNGTTTGTIVLTGSNSLTGTYSIRSGNLQLGNGGTTGQMASLSSVLIGNGASYTINRSDLIVQGTHFAAVAASSAGNFIQAGSGTAVYVTPLNFSGTTFINNGALQLGNAGNNGGALGPGIVNNSKLIWNRTGSGTFRSLLTGTGSFDIIQQPEGSSNSTINFTGTSYLTGTTTFRNVLGGDVMNTTFIISATSGAYFGGDIVVEAHGENSSGATSIRVGSTSLTSTGTLGGRVALNGELTNLALYNTVYTSSLNNAFSGNGAISTNSTYPSAITLTGSNSFNGLMSIVGSSVLTVGDGGTNGYINPSSFVGSSGTFVINRSGTMSIGPGVSAVDDYWGSAGMKLVAAGPATLLYSTGLSSYSVGDVTLSGGGLFQVQDYAYANVTFDSAGATVTGTGYIGSYFSSTASGYGLISPGVNSAHTAQMYTFSDAAVANNFDFDFGATGTAVWSNAESTGNDVLLLNGGLTSPFVGTFNIYFSSTNAGLYQGGIFVVTGTGSQTAGSAQTSLEQYLSGTGASPTFNYFWLDPTNGSVEHNGQMYSTLSGTSVTRTSVAASGTFTDFNTTPGAWSTVQNNGFTMQFVVVPEPGTLALAATGIVGGLWTARRRLLKRFTKQPKQAA